MPNYHLIGLHILKSVALREHRSRPSLITSKLSKEK